MVGKTVNILSAGCVSFGFLHHIAYDASFTEICLCRVIQLQSFASMEPARALCQELAPVCECPDSSRMCSLDCTARCIVVNSLANGPWRAQITVAKTLECPQNSKANLAT